MEKKKPQAKHIRRRKMHLIVIRLLCTNKRRIENCKDIVIIFTKHLS